MNITGIARENFEEAGLPLKNTIELTTKNEYTIPDIWGLKVGRKFLDTGEIESHFEEQQFFEIRKRATLLEYPHTVILMEQDFAERKVIDYYVIYDIKESSKYKPTIVNEYVDKSFKCRSSEELDEISEELLDICYTHVLHVRKDDVRTIQKIHKKI